MKGVYFECLGVDLRAIWIWICSGRRLGNSSTLVNMLVFCILLAIGVRSSSSS